MRPITKADRVARRKLFIPDAASPDPRNSDAGAIFIYVPAMARAILAAVAFRGSAAKPEWHYHFKGPEDLKVATDRFFDSIAASAKRLADRRAEKSAWVNPLVPGDVLYTSWGYDQTNVDFYAVTRVSGKRTWVKEIAAETKETGFMSGRTKPVLPITYLDKAETMHIAAPDYKGGASIKISESATAWKTDPTAEHSTSWYA